MVGMKDLIKIGLVGVGAYLIYDHVSKKKRNTEKVETVKAISEQSKKAQEELAKDDSQEIVNKEALAEELGDEAYTATEVSLKQQVGFDGWDSDTVSVGI